MEYYRRINADLLGCRAPPLQYDLHSAETQSWFKEMAWWTTEELIEAQWGCWEENTDKVLEELADALHFQTELCISVGCPVRLHHRLPRHWPITANFRAIQRPFAFRQFTMAILEELGMGMWLFRNKAWKQTQALTDIPEFRACMMRTHRGLLDLMGFWGDPQVDRLRFAVTTYLRKSEVNLWRIKTQY